MWRTPVGGPHPKHPTKPFEVLQVGLRLVHPPAQAWDWGNREGRKGHGVPYAGSPQPVTELLSSILLVCRPSSKPENRLGSGTRGGGGGEA